MGEALNKITVGELMGILAGLVAIYMFTKSIIVPLVKKWLKVDKNASDLSTLKTIPDRVAALETKSIRDYERLNTIDGVNVLMMEALQALIRNRRTNNDVDKLKTVEDKIDGYLIGRVRS